MPEETASEARYHHGDLPGALLAATADAIEEEGVAALSLRDVARRAGVSHAAPAHHFTDKKGLLTAFATQGFEMFADALEDAATSVGEDASPRERFSRVGQAYVEFSVTHRAHFEVMWRPDICDPTEPAMSGPLARAYASLREGVFDIQQANRRADITVEDGMLAAWSVVHGLSWLILQQQAGMFGDDPAELTARVTEVLFPG